MSKRRISCRIITAVVVEEARDSQMISQQIGTRKVSMTNKSQGIKVVGLVMGMGQSLGTAMVRIGSREISKMEMDGEMTLE